MTEVQLIASPLFDNVAAQAGSSPRLRMNHNFHSGPEDNPHRFLNVLLHGTYIRPHRHLMPPKSESFLVLEGIAEVIVFDDEGAMTARYQLGGETEGAHVWGIDIPPGLWHTIVARTPRVVCYEVKPGPWIPGTDKEFADWAPAEGDSAASGYLATLMA
jgi:cupin fold WbuC family metalloprotein